MSRALLGYPGHGFPPFTAKEVFWLNCPAIIFSFMSLCGSLFIIGSYLYMDRLKTLVNSLVAWLSFSDLCLVITMSISITTAATNGQFAYIYAEHWFPIIQITNFFIAASWLWSAAIAFASLNVGSFTLSQEREKEVMSYIHKVVWTASFAVTVVLSIFNDFLKEPVWAMRLQALFGLFIYVWNLFLFVFVMSRIRVITREFVFIEEQRKMRQMMISLVIYLVPFIICWSVFVVCGMITFRASFNSAYAQKFGFWTLIFMACLPPLQGACNALAFGLTTFEGPRLLLLRLFSKYPIVHNDSSVTSNTEESLPIAYYDSDNENENEHRSQGSIKSLQSFRGYKKSFKSFKSSESTTSLIVPSKPPSSSASSSIPTPYQSSVYLIYFNSFMYYFSLGMKLMVKWTYVEELHGSLFDFGCTMAAFGLGWAISAIPSAMWARRFNTRQVLIGTTLSSLLASVLWACAAHPSMLIASRFLSGLAAGNITVGRSFLATVATPETRTVIMANSSAASMLGSVLGPLLSLVLSYTPNHHFSLGSMHLRFDQFTYPGWLIIFICIGYLILLALFFKEPSKNNASAAPAPKLTTPIILCGALVCITLCMLSFFETISLPIMIIMFRWSIPQACAVWIGLGCGSFLIQLVGIRIMNQQLKVSILPMPTRTPSYIEDRFGIYLGLCIGLFGSLVLTGYTWQCNVTAMLIGSIAIVSISGAFLFTFSLALIAKYLGRATIHYLGHVFTAGAIGRIVGPMWAVAASTRFSTIGLSLNGVDAKDINSLLPFAGCSVLLFATLVVINIHYKKLLPS